MPILTVTICGRCGRPHTPKWKARRVRVRVHVGVFDVAAAGQAVSADGTAGISIATAERVDTILSIDDACKTCFEALTRLLDTFKGAYPGGKRRKKKRAGAAGAGVQMEMIPAVGGAIVSGGPIPETAGTEAAS